MFSLPNTELKGRTNLEHNRKQWRNLNYHRQRQAVEESLLKVLRISEKSTRLAPLNCRLYPRSYLPPRGGGLGFGVTPRSFDVDHLGHTTVFSHKLAMGTALEPSPRHQAQILLYLISYRTAREPPNPALQLPPQCGGQTSHTLQLPHGSTKDHAIEHRHACEGPEGCKENLKCQM